MTDTTRPPNSDIPEKLFRSPSLLVRGAILVLGLVALSTAGYLASLTYSGDNIAGCGGGVMDCNKVLQSPWSSWLGIPVSFLAVSTYGCLLVATSFSGPAVPPILARFSWNIVTILSVMVAATAVWFLGLQFLVIRSLCIYCLTTHLCGLAIAAITLLRQPVKFRYLIGFVPLSVLIAGQIVAPEKQYAIESFENIDEDEPVVFVDSGEYSRMADGASTQAAPVADTEESVNPALETDHHDANPIAPVEDGGQLDPADDESDSHPPTGGNKVSLTTPKDVRKTKIEVYRPEIDAELPVDDIDPTDANITTVDPSELATPVPINEGQSAPLPTQANGQQENSVPGTPDPSKTADSTLREESTGQDGPQQKVTLATANEAAEKPHVEKARTSRVLTYLNGRAKLDAYTQPILGSPEAEHVLVEVFDYTCYHCRQMHKHIDAALTRYGEDQLAIIVLVVPMNASCNEHVKRTPAIHRDACELAKLAIAVWLHAPDKFPDYHHWMFDSTQPRVSTEARIQASRIIGQEKLNMELKHWAAGRKIRAHAKLYKAARAGRIPKLLFPNKILKGETKTPGQLFHILETHLALKPVGQGIDE